MSTIDKIVQLTKQLFPTGRAFKIPNDGVLDNLNKALGAIGSNTYADAVGILDALLPDNNNFTTDDATDWERRLGLISNPLVPLADRKMAIRRKMSSPGLNPAKGHYLYIQSQLQAAGFNVFVYENRFVSYPDGFETKTPLEVSLDPNIFQSVEHGDFQHGDAQHGGIYNNKIVNNIDEAKDLIFNEGTNFRRTFFIGGDPIGSFATVDINRKAEFRQLILKLKPLNTLGYLFIQYI